MTVNAMQGRAAPQGSPGASPAVALWLAVIAGLVFAMIVVGGATRLTDSGLSITEWRPIVGAIPPLSAADWQDAFDKYKQIPEYKLVNKGMTLDAFKVIFWWEWGHRFLGRLVGVAFALPLLAFWWTGRLPHGLAPRLAALFALGGLQGAIGWYMVQSGLVDRVDVSQYRLALHLTVAFLILALLVWTLLSLRATAPAAHLATVTPGQRRTAYALVALVLAQVVLGAFVAGTKAGLVYNTWPDMNGRLLPDAMTVMTPWYLNLTENLGVVQFNHRIMAYLLLALAAAHAWRLARTADDERLRASAAVLAMAMVAQAGLGIWTLIAAEGAIPIGLGLAHQGGAAVVLIVAVWHAHAMRSAARR